MNEESVVNRLEDLANQTKIPLWKLEAASGKTDSNNPNPNYPFSEHNPQREVFESWARLSQEEILTISEAESFTWKYWGTGFKLGDGPQTLSRQIAVTERTLGFCTKYSEKKKIKNSPLLPILSIKFEVLLYTLVNNSTSISEAKSAYVSAKDYPGPQIAALNKIIELHQK